jgi:hypothetical protein
MLCLCLRLYKYTCHEFWIIKGMFIYIFFCLSYSNKNNIVIFFHKVCFIYFGILSSINKVQKIIVNLRFVLFINSI